MHAFFTLLVAALAIAATLASPLVRRDTEGWTGCLNGGFSTIMDVQDILLNPRPVVTGTDATVTLAGTLLGDLLPGAKGKVQVIVFGVPFKNLEVDMCEDALVNLGFPCPIPAGTFVTVNKSLPVDAATPPLKGATLKISIINGDQALVGCAETKIDIVKP